MVQDLRIINKTAEPRHSAVPDPYIILNQVSSSHCYYSVLDIKDDIWGCPLTKHSKQYFAFVWEQEGKGKIVKTWMVLPQGYMEALVISGQDIKSIYSIPRNCGM